MELFNQSALDLGTYDDGPYEVAGENSQKPELIPLPYNSYLGMRLWLVAEKSLKEKENCPQIILTAALFRLAIITKLSINVYNYCSNI